MFPTAKLNTHSYSFIFIIQWRAIFLPRNGGLRMASWRLAFHHCRLSHCHHDIGRILSEVIPQYSYLQRCIVTHSLSEVIPCNTDVDPFIRPTFPSMHYT